MSAGDSYSTFKKYWNIFVPQNLLAKAPGFLTGYINSDEGLVCVLGLLLATTQDRDREHHVKSERIVGYWYGNDKQSFDRKLSNLKQLKCRDDDTNLVHIFFEESSLCCIVGRIERSGEENKIPTCIIFEASDILTSFVLVRPEDIALQVASSKVSYKEFREVSNTTKSFLIPDVMGERIGHVLRNFQLEKCLDGEHSLYKKRNPYRLSHLATSISCFLPCFIMTMLAYCHTVIIHQSSSQVKNLLCVPNFSKHLIERCKRSQDILELDQTKSFNKFILYNAYVQHVFESLIGVCVLYFMVTNNMADTLSSAVLDWADDVASGSNDLIKWLMGAPAGLKLNSQLTSMLGHFFIYHIYLWTGYLVVLRTALPWLLMIASWAGILGVSFQLCIVKDIIAMLTLHIYCFYVYAARIFNLEVSALSSMWRLFRGKKWNSLRSRVDSAAYNTDQLFVGTLLFTVLLFLLPTTTLYYAVFTGLRIVTLTAQAILSYLINVISVTPIYSLVLRVVRARWIAGNVEFEPVHLARPPSNLVLNMKTSQISMSELISLTSPYLNQSQPSVYSWGHFLSCLTSGKILYPWMVVVADDKDSQGHDGKAKQE